MKKKKKKAVCKTARRAHSQKCGNFDSVAAKICNVKIACNKALHGRITLFKPIC